MYSISEFINFLKCLRLRTDISLGEDGYKILDELIEFVKNLDNYKKSNINKQEG
jgi:hypothetical protein